MSVKPIDIKDQPRPGFTRIMSITLNGVRYRLFRSSVTMVVITVAIAFLMNILTENLIKTALVTDAIERLADHRLPAFWASRLTTPASTEALLLQLADHPPDSLHGQELASFGGLSGSEIEALHADATIGAAYIRLLSELDYGRQRLLTGGNVGLAIFDYLRNEENFESYTTNLAGMQTLRLPTSNDEFRGFLERWPESREKILKIRNGQQTAIARVRSELGNDRLAEALADADGVFGDTVRDAGFMTLDAASAERLARQSVLELTADQVEADLESIEVRQQVAVRLNMLPQEVGLQVLWPALNRGDGAAWFAGLFEDGRLDPELLSELAAQRVEQQKLTAIEPMQAEIGGGFMGMGERITWLILLSLIVCTVGIANAMLMSVTERYREIATFKCLGALDGSIMLIFIIEASLLGSVGGALGAIVGGVLGLLSMIFSHGILVFASIPVLSLLLCVLISIAAGLLLASLASIYPSQKAARLAPMEAMRIE
jgi:putative ABC transport system permease protein